MAQLSVVLDLHPHTASVFEAPITLTDGAELVAEDFSVYGDASVVAARMARQVPGFDQQICEMPIVNYLSAKEHGVAITGVPIFITRRFLHDTIICNRETGVREPKDLEGKHVGIPYYGHTDVTWARGMLSDSFGVDLDSITWVTAGEEQVSGAVVPGNVKHVPKLPIDDLLRSGDLAGQITGHSALGRMLVHPHVELVLPDTESVVKEWYDSTGIFPILHLIVVQDRLLEEHPHLAQDLFNIFSSAKEAADERVSSGAGLSPTEIENAWISGYGTSLPGSDREYLGPNPLTYGLAGNRANLERILGYAVDQHVVNRRFTVEELFTSVEE